MMGGTVGVAATGAIFQSKLGAFDPATLSSGGPAAAENFTEALGAAMAMGCAVTAVGAVIAALVIRGRAKHELAPTVPRSCRAPPARSARRPRRVTHLTQAYGTEMVAGM